MGGDIDQRPVVMLAVDFHDLRADPLQQAGRDRLVVDEGAGAPVGELHAPQDDVLVVGNGIVAQRRTRRVVGGQLQHGDHLAALLPAAHQRGVAPAPQRQGQCVQQDGFARPGLPRENGHAAIQRQVELVDQNDIANRKRVQHARTIPKLVHTQEGRASVTASCNHVILLPPRHSRESGNPSFAQAGDSRFRGMTQMDRAGLHRAPQP